MLTVIVKSRKHNANNHDNANKFYKSRDLQGANDNSSLEQIIILA